MPKSSNGIDVSREEERYLRRAFRRFAVPYVFVFAVLAWATTAVMSKNAPAGSPKELSSLRESVAALEQSVVALKTKMDTMGAELERAGSRVGALETRKSNRDTAASPDTAELERALNDASRRIADLERRNGSGGASAAERIDALAARMQRLEATARSAAPSMPAAPAPAAPAPAPAAPAP